MSIQDDELIEDIASFTLHECREWLLESEISSHDHPRPNPWKMTVDELREILGPESNGEPMVVLLERAVEGIDAGIIDGIDNWRAACLKS